MLIAKIYIRTPKDTKYQNSEMIYKSRKTLNYQRYDIPKDIKISKEKKRKTKDIIYQKYTRIPKYVKDNIYKYQSITKDIKLYQYLRFNTIRI